MVQMNVTLTKEQLIEIVNGTSKVYKQKLTVQHNLEDDLYDRYSSKQLMEREEAILINPTDVVVVYPTKGGMAVLGSVKEPVKLEPTVVEEEVEK